MKYPFADLFGLKITQSKDGVGKGEMMVEDKYHNPYGYAHGAVAYALADTVMGAAAFSTLSPGERSVTIEIKMNYLAPISNGLLQCESNVVHRGKRVIALDAYVYSGGKMVAKAMGSFLAFVPSGGEKPQE